MKQSSIEFAVTSLEKLIPSGNQLVVGAILLQAKEMHKEEMIEFAKDYGEFSHLDYIVEEGYDKRFNTKEK